MVERNYIEPPYEERPIIEFPAIIIMGIIFLSFCLALSVLFLPWYVSLVLFIGLCLGVAIFFNPYISIFIFLIGAFFHPTQWFPQLQAIHLVRYFAIGVLFIWGFHIIVYRDFKLVKAPQNFFIVIFMGLAFISILKNFDYISTYFFEFSIRSTVLYFIISNLVKSKTQVIGLIWFLVIINVILCFIGFYQYAHGIGEVYPELGVVRIKGLAVESNVFALDLTIALPLAFGLFFAYRHLFLKTLLILIIFLLSLTTIFTFSRAGFLGLIIVFVLSFWFRFFKRKKFQTLLIGTILILVVALITPAKYWERVRSIADISDPSIERRLVGWKSGWEMMIAHPIRGVGFGVFRYAFMEHAMEKGRIGERFYRVPTDAHNVYLQTAGEMGLPGLTFLLLLIIWTFKDLIKSRRIFVGRDDLLMTELSLSLEISMVSYLIAGMFLSLLYLKIFWIIIPMAVAFKQISLIEDGDK